MRQSTYMWERATNAIADRGTADASVSGLDVGSSAVESARVTRRAGRGRTGRVCALLAAGIFVELREDNFSGEIWHTTRAHVPGRSARLLERWPPPAPPRPSNPRWP